MLEKEILKTIVKQKGDCDDPIMLFCKGCPVYSDTDCGDPKGILKSAKRRLKEYK